MKPIHLKLSGLQSYRDAQEIDFTALCETGLFGIFGPTGSGKSTVLDAITLAMYGKVERAANGTQGIMNLNENQLAVSFTFELLSVDGPKRYRVERRFKRMNEISISNTVSRFVEITAEGEAVLADKLADVTRCVEEIIGLTITDFTRAVVLPQGKFAEFLALKGSERRQMLQRLFHLEKYGDELMFGLSRRLKETDVRLKEVAAEQQGLGDASEATVSQASETLEQARQQAEEQRMKRKKLETEVDRVKATRDQGLELSGLLHKQAELTTKDPHIAELEQMLTRADAARRLIPFLHEYEQSALQLAERKAVLATVTQKEQHAREAAERAATTFDERQRQLSEQEPKLLLRLDHLEQARSLEQECKQLKQETAELAQRNAQNAEQQAGVTEQLAKLQLQREKALKRQAELTEALKANEVRPEWREQVQRADRLHQSIEALDRQWQGATSELEAIAERMKQAEQAHQAQEALEREIYDENLRTLDRIHSLYVSLHREQKRHANLQQVLTDEITRLRRVEREQEIEMLSAKLAEQLVQGEPCPVCGSTAHQSHSRDKQDKVLRDNKSADISAQLTAAEPLVQALHEMKAASLQLISRLHALPTALEMEGTGISSQLEAAVTLQGEQGSLEQEEASQSMTAELDGLQAAYASQRTAQKEYSTEVEQLEQFAKQHRARVSGLQRQSSQLRADRQALEELHHSQQRMIQSITNERAVLLEQWEKQIPTAIARVSIESILLELKNKDEQLHDIQDRLERSVPFIDEMNAQLLAKSQELAALEKDGVLIMAQLEGKSQLVLEKEVRLQQLIGLDAAVQTVAGLILETEAKLSTLRADALSAKSLRDQANTLLQTLSAEAVQAQQSALSAEERAAQAERIWIQQRSDSIFTPQEDVRRATLTQEQMADYQQAISLHRQLQQQFASQIQRLEEKLQGERVSEDAWEQLMQSMQQQLAQDEEAVRAKAKAERDLEELTRRAERWSVLEQQRIVEQALLERLSQLQAVFRGNAFVEFIAEEQLMQVSRAASERLRFLTKQRYALEVDSTGGFVIRDDANGGVRRPVSTLSGGETFLTSLALALALSAQIQLQGKYPLQFFFLDEGFGTLDPELLDTVITALEKLHLDRLTVGIISHVPELRARLPRKLVVTPAQQSGEGSTIALESI
ncbi:SbcC/MukB-like Walker B domain-containing protein [Paenibacillus guangzhouensis]|uniref:SbcC/MukB-like Walker B domain-containing protein n=1 Tax=Paenibacillus guangzhouensis TaxID=1473112 RepID=UPI001266BC28|nr:SbcC/MukB-like Walker B domain-containing protein [Paenibacillus guangzhouensis]